MTEDLVSIILTTHNRIDLLPRALKSALQQTYPNFEVIVVDDASSDGTRDLMEEYLAKHHNLLYLRHNQSKGGCAARNYGIREARGKFVIGLDDDDAYHPTRIEKLIKNYDPSLAFVASGTIRHTKNKKPVLHFPKPILTFEDFKWKNPGAAFPLIEKTKIEEVGMFDEELTAAQDYDMWFRLIGRYRKAIVVQEPLYEIYDDADRRIGTSEGKIPGRAKFIEKHKSEFTEANLRYHRYYIKKLKGEKVAFWEWLNSVPIHLWKIEYRYLVKSLLPTS